MPIQRKRFKRSEPCSPIKRVLFSTGVHTLESSPSTVMPKGSSSFASSHHSNVPATNPRLKTTTLKRSRLPR
jgi:hypothetical protein